MNRVEHLDGQIQILALAAQDMKQVVAACDALEQDAVPVDLSEALVTAIVVSYARPFSQSNTVGTLGKQWRPPADSSERELHDWLIDERKKRYAHTDSGAGRFVMHHGDPETGFKGLAVLTVPFPIERIGQIRDQATDLRDRLNAAAFEAQEKLQREFSGYSSSAASSSSS